MGASGPDRRRRLVVALALLASLLVPLVPAAGAPADAPPGSAARQAAGAQSPGVAPEADRTTYAHLEARRPTVQWSPAGATDWQEVPDRLTVQAGDRLRTNDSGAARLSLTAATIADVGPATGLL